MRLFIRAYKILDARGYITEYNSKPILANYSV